MSDRIWRSGVAEAVAQALALGRSPREGWSVARVGEGSRSADEAVNQSGAAADVIVATPTEFDETLLVIDLREHRDVVVAVDDALGRFEYGAPPPVGARDLLTDIVDALDETGLAGAGLTTSQWESAHKVTERTLKGLDKKPPAVQARKIEGALRQMTSPHDRGVQERPRPNQRSGFRAEDRGTGSHR